MKTEPMSALLCQDGLDSQTRRSGLSRLVTSRGLPLVLGALASLLVAIPVGCLSAPTITVHGAISPNGRSPNWSNWWNHAIAAVQTGATNTGDPFTDPSAWVERTTFRYIETIETRDPDSRIDLGFNSWLGLAEPEGVAAQESGGMLCGVADILGNGTKIKLSNVRWFWSDDGGAFILTNSTAMTHYHLGSIGIDYGKDGKRGGGDDVVVEPDNGDAATPVDEIVFIPGPFYYAKTFDFQAAPAGLTPQGTLNWADDFITKNDGYAPSNTFGFYLYDDNGSLITSATLHFTITDQPTLYASHTKDQFVLKWPGLGFVVENSPVLGPTATWTEVSGGTNSPVMIPLNGGKANFTRLRKQ